MFTEGKSYPQGSGSEESPETTKVIRKDLDKALTNYLIDPRSPTLHLNRTPIVLEEISILEAEQEEDFHIEKCYRRIEQDTIPENPPQDASDDVLSTTPMRKQSYSGQENDPNEANKANMGDADKCSKAENETSPKASDEASLPNKLVTNNTKQQVYDPRSPSWGVERTPIVFDTANDSVCNAEGDTHHEEIKSMSASKTFDFSSPCLGNEVDGSLSMASEINLLAVDENGSETSALKSLQNRMLLYRMRSYRKRRKNRTYFNRLPAHRPAHHKPEQKIYEDLDAQTDRKVAPKQASKTNNDGIAASDMVKNKRNPLIAMDNCSDPRLRSLEPNTKIPEFNY